MVVVAERRFINDEHVTKDEFGRDLKLIPLKGGVFHILLNSLEDQSYVMAMGVVDLKPRVFRVSRWFLHFDPLNFKPTTSQVWIFLLDLPLDYRKDQNVLNIVAGVGLPLKIDPLTRNLYHDAYARVLVDVDFTQPLSEKNLTKMFDEDSNIDVNFSSPIQYEKLPNFCT